MKTLTRNPEFAKLLRTITFLFLIFTIIALAMGFTSLIYFRDTAAQNNAAIIGALVRNYPGAEEDMIRRLLEPDADSVHLGQTVLAKYGINKGTYPDLPLLRTNFLINTVMYLSLSLLICATFLLIIVKFLKTQYGQIRLIAEYAGKISQSDYSMDIRDNAEGDISWLKNEIYKITTMLRTQAEINEKDKLSLATAMADISHQLKTPLTSILVLNDLLDSDPPPETKAEFRNRIKAQINRIRWLVTSMLNLAKFDAGAMKMKKEPVLVIDMVEKAIADLNVPADIKQQTITVTGDEACTFTGDMKWTCEALINILKNCVEHTPEKGHIKISLEENPLYTEIVVRDDGPGIAKEDLPYIFNRFYKGKNAGADSVGIGLAMSAAILAQQGGDISVKSEEGRGTEFTIKFYKIIT